MWWYYDDPQCCFFVERDLYLGGEPILLQEWPEGDSIREKGISGKYQRLLKLAPLSVRLGKISR